MYIILCFTLLISYICGSLGNSDFTNTSCLVEGIWIQGEKIDFSSNIREYKIVLEKHIHKLETFIYISYASKKLDTNKLASNRKLLNDNEISNKIHFDYLGKSTNFMLDLVPELNLKSCNISLIMNKMHIKPTFPNFWLLDINDLSSIKLKITVENSVGKSLNEYYIHIFNDKFKNVIEVDNVSIFDNKNVSFKMEPPFSPTIYRYKILINPMINDHIKITAKCKYNVFINDIEQQSLTVNIPNDKFQTIIKISCVNVKNKTIGVPESYYFHFIYSTNENITSPKSIIPLATGSPCLLTESDDIHMYNCYGTVDPVSFVMQTKPTYLYAIKSQDKRYIFYNTTTVKIYKKSDIQLEILNGREKRVYKFFFNNTNEKYIQFKYLPFYNKIIVLLFILTFMFSSLMPSLLQIILSRNYNGINYFPYIFNIIITYIAIRCLDQNKNINRNISSIMYNIYSFFLKIDSNDPWSFTSCANLIWSYTHYKLLFILIRFICSRINIFYNGINSSNYIFMDYNSVSIGNLDWPLKTFISFPLFGACYTILHNAIHGEVIHVDNLLIKEVFNNNDLMLSRLKIHSISNIIKWVIFETNIPLLCTTLILLIDLIYNFYQYFNKCYNAVKHGYLIWRWNDNCGGDHLSNNGYWSDRFCNQLYTEYNSSSEIFDCHYQDFCGLTEIFDFEKLKNKNYVLEHQNNKPPWNNFDDAEKMDLNFLSPKYYDLNDTVDAKSNISEELNENIPICVKINKLLHYSSLYRSFGLIQCGWIDILLDWKFTKEIYMQDIDLSKFKLITKSTQLHGPLSNGEFKPIFNGTRVPHIFFELFTIRCILGILFGIIINKTNSFIQNFGLVLITTLFCLMMTRIIVSWPYNKDKDNIILLICLLVETLLVVSFQFNLFGIKWISNVFLAVLEFTIQFGIIIAFLHSLLFIYYFALNNKSKLYSYCNCILSIEFPETNTYCISHGFSKVPIYSARITFDNNPSYGINHDKVYISPIITNLPPIIAISSDDFRSFTNNVNGIQIPEIIIFFGGADIYRLSRIIIYDIEKKNNIISEILKDINEYSNVADEINMKILKYHKTHVPTNSILSIIINDGHNIGNSKHSDHYEDESTVSRDYYSELKN